MLPSQSLPSSIDDEESLCVTTQNTYGQTLCQWYPSKCSDTTPTNLMLFIRENLGIPYECQVVYYENQSLTFNPGELLISNRICDNITPNVQLALRNYCTEYDQTVIDGFAERFDLKQVRCIQVIDKRCSVTSYRQCS